eukprot:7502665-Pyramimonas_sp.AAC.1
MGRASRPPKSTTVTTATRIEDSFGFEHEAAGPTGVPPRLPQRRNSIFPGRGQSQARRRKELWATGAF